MSVRDLLTNVASDAADHYVSPAVSRAADLGFCTPCALAGQFVPALPGRGTCPFHARQPQRAAEKPVERPATPTPSPAPVRPAVTRTAGRARVSDTARPRRRRPIRSRRPDGRYLAPHTVAVICALPAGSRRAHDQAEALRALEAAPGLNLLRSDRQATIGAVWAALVRRSDWASRTVTTSWEVLCATSGRSRATVARSLAWLREAGLLGVVETGATAAAIGSDRNRLPTYVLAVPVAPAPVDELETPPGGSTSVVPPIAGARENSPTPVDNQARPDGHLATTKPTAAAGRRPSWPMSAAPGNRREQLEACEQLRWEAVTLRPLSARMLRHILRPWLEAGWSPRDVLHALDHLPSGEAWRYAGLPRAVAAWVRYRLAAWTDPATGVPVASRSQRARAAAGTLRAQRASRHHVTSGAGAPSTRAHAREDRLTR